MACHVCLRVVSLKYCSQFEADRDHALSKDGDVFTA
jgi:hypothetical protein